MVIMEGYVTYGGYRKMGKNSDVKSSPHCHRIFSVSNRYGSDYPAPSTQPAARDSSLLSSPKQRGCWLGPSSLQLHPQGSLPLRHPLPPPLVSGSPPRPDAIAWPLWKTLWVAGWWCRLQFLLHHDITCSPIGIIAESAISKFIRVRYL